LFFDRHCSLAFPYLFLGSENQYTGKL
jgi:hypothetical protein